MWSKLFKIKSATWNDLSFISDTNIQMKFKRVKIESLDFNPIDFTKEK